MASEQKHHLTKAQAAVLGALSADAFALSYHWVYDVTQIKKPVEPVLHDPHATYHKDKGKVKGDFTHIGDQLILLLQQLAQHKKFDINDYGARFKALFSEGYKGWLTGYTKKVLEAFANNVTADKIGPDVDDTDPIGRISPFLLIHNNEADFVADAKKYVAFTNNNADVLRGTEFFSHVLFQVLAGKTPTAAMQDAIKSEPFSKYNNIVEGVTAGIASKDDDTTATIAKFGQSCPLTKGLPSVVHLIAKYENDLTKGFQENVGAGGDSSARGMVMGMIIAAHSGEKGLPAFTKDFKAYADVLKLFEQFK